VSRAQARFEGSDRQARGRLMKALVTAPVAVDRVPDVMRRGPDDAARLLDDLLRERLCVRDATSVRLP